jgi:cytochrome c oxidase subunit IV
MADSHEYSDHAPTHHVTSLPVYFGIFAALMILTMITVAISRVDLGSLNTPIALAIAVVKATLVILFFMHVIHSTRLTWVVIISSLMWLALLFVLTFADFFTRDWQLY